jgi:predicted nucleic acid-binding protein
LILVDSSVWIDYFNGRACPETDRLDELLGTELLLVGDLILAEVLQGFRGDRAFRTARRLLGQLAHTDLVGRRVALAAADNYRRLRRRGVTVRKTMDVVIATHCLCHDRQLLFTDCDFEPMVEHLGLRRA